MNCDAGCKNVVGESYNLIGHTLCHHCGYEHELNYPAVYQGMENKEHIYRVHHSVLCPGCGIRLTHVNIRCSQNDFDKEISKLFRIPVSMQGSRND